MRQELSEFKAQLEEAKKRFEAAFHTEPESREAMREQREKAHSGVQPVSPGGERNPDDCVKRRCRSAITGRLFDWIRQQIEAERESASSEAIKQHAATLAKRIVRVVEEPEPIYREKLSS